MEALKREGDGVLVRLRVQPKASRDAIIVEPGGRIRAALTAPPVEGAANKALRSVLAKRLGVSKSAVQLVRGEKSREKSVLVRGIGLATVRKRLEET